MLCWQNSGAVWSLKLHFVIARIDFFFARQQFVARHMLSADKKLSSTIEEVFSWKIMFSGIQKI